jgi:hypothetical protein
MGGQLARTAELDAAILGTLAALAGTSIERGQPGQDRDHQLAVRRGRVRPWIAEGSELGPDLGDCIEQIEQIAGAPGQSIKAADNAALPLHAVTNSRHSSVPCQERTTRTQEVPMRGRSRPIGELSWIDLLCRIGVLRGQYGSLSFMLMWCLNHNALYYTPQGNEAYRTIIDLETALVDSGALPHYFVNAIIRNGPLTRNQRLARTFGIDRNGKFYHALGELKRSLRKSA